MSIPLLKEPNGYYSFPAILGSMFSATGRPQILGYYPDSVREWPTDPDMWIDGIVGTSPPPMPLSIWHDPEGAS